MGHRRRRRRSARARRPRRTGGTGSVPATRRSRATATGSRPATPRTSRCSPSLGLTHHRLSIEWARIEPEPGVHDPAAVDALPRRARRRRATPASRRGCACTTSRCPAGSPAEGGFLVERNRTGAWTRHVEFIAETFGDLVGGWQPVNETNYYARAAYRRRRMAARAPTTATQVAIVDEAIQLATAEAAVRLRQTGAPVSSIFGLSRDRRAGRRSPRRAATPPRCTSCSGRRASACSATACSACAGRDPIERPDLAGAFDLIGFSYYSAMGVRERPPRRPSARRAGVAARLRDLGRRARRSCSIACTPRLPGTPLLVAEYGIGTDDDDAARRATSQRGLEVTHDALERGIDVRGFFHWTASTTTSGCTATTSRSGSSTRPQRAAERRGAAARSNRMKQAALRRRTMDRWRPLRRHQRNAVVPRKRRRGVPERGDATQRLALPRRHGSRASRRRGRVGDADREASRRLSSRRGMADRRVRRISVRQRDRGSERSRTITGSHRRAGRHSDVRSE